MKPDVKAQVPTNTSAEPVMKQFCAPAPRATPIEVFSLARSPGFGPNCKWLQGTQRAWDPTRLATCRDPTSRALWRACPTDPAPSLAPRHGEGTALSAPRACLRPGPLDTVQSDAATAPPDHAPPLRPSRCSARSYLLFKRCPTCHLLSPQHTFPDLPRRHLGGQYCPHLSPVSSAHPSGIILSTL